LTEERNEVKRAVKKLWAERQGWRGRGGVIRIRRGEGDGVKGLLRFFVKRVTLWLRSERELRSRSFQVYFLFISHATVCRVNAFRRFFGCCVCS